MPDAAHRLLSDRLVGELTPYEQATVGLWARRYQELMRQPDHGHLIEAAIHAVLAGLRREVKPRSLFAAYEQEAAADLALIRSLLLDPSSEEQVWLIRDAAFHLRWIELAASP